MLGRFLVPSLAVLVLLSACAGTPDAPAEQERTIAYMKIFEETPAGVKQVGWLEKREHTDEDGVRSVVDFIKAMNFDVRGYIRSEGHAVKFVDKSPYYQTALGEKRHYVELTKAPRGHLVGQILDLPLNTPVKFTTATVADIRGQ